MSEKNLIWEKLTAIQKDIEPILKSKKAEKSAGGYAFRGIDDLYNAIHPLHKKHEVVVMPELIESSREHRKSSRGGDLTITILKIRYDFVAKDGSKASVTTQGEAMDSGDKSTNKAMSAALKYALMHIYLIPTENILDVDPDAKGEILTDSPSKETELKNDYTQLKEVLPVVDSKSDFLELWKDEYLQSEELKSLFAAHRERLKKEKKWQD